ncbi:hypothetical protein AVEN_33365-1 [Araneus ventricosus]|uniref:Uncharacterized protein n=1 Tax=Araneus ventricosus TaxID=182803 RepID=A0A4Y2RUY3_ARAVE|nr:hypothetical protein AVEN_274596-1 [Araneus ventricosus]GBN79186.1 hypothetical protein AVEN_33365-1 [Araneus ventricosus]
MVATYTTENTQSLLKPMGFVGQRPKLLHKQLLKNAISYRAYDSASPSLGSALVFLNDSWNDTTASHSSMRPGLAAAQDVLGSWD